MDAREYLEIAIEEAKGALNTGNYPFGVVVVDSNGDIVASGHNENFSTHDISAHAEIQVLRKIDIKKLLDKEKQYYIFVSGEPCGGCSFFIARTNITHVCWALTDPQKAGFGDLIKDASVNESFHNISVSEEPFADLKEKSAALLRQYYQTINRLEKASLY